MPSLTRVLQELFSVAIITQIGMCKTSPIIFYCYTVNVLFWSRIFHSEAACN
jgi:hypothetical protein